MQAGNQFPSDRHEWEEAAVCSQSYIDRLGAMEKQSAHWLCHWWISLCCLCVSKDHAHPWWWMFNAVGSMLRLCHGSHRCNSQSRLFFIGSGALSGTSSFQMFPIFSHANNFQTPSDHHCYLSVIPHCIVHTLHYSPFILEICSQKHLLFSKI